MNERTAPARGRPRGFSTDAALDRAIPVFWARGYAGASVADLCAATGLAPPSLYAAFGSKKGLFLACLDRYAATLGRGPFEAAAAAPPDTARAAFADGALRLVFGGEAGRGCLVASCGAEAAGGDGEIRAAVGRIMRASVTALDALRGRGGLAEGEVLLAALQAAAVRARAGACPAEVRALMLRLIG
jgi:TetR/AcrR family transcriptional repressor of nem operon